MCSFRKAAQTEKAQSKAPQHFRFAKWPNRPSDNGSASSSVYHFRSSNAVLESSDSTHGVVYVVAGIRDAELD
jgi:hypothetical protein